MGYLAGGLVFIVEDAYADGLGEGNGQAGLGGVVAHELFGRDDTGGGHAIEWFRGGNGMAAGNRDAGFGGYVHAAAQDLAQHVESELFIGPAYEVDGGNGGAAHGIDIRKRVGRSHSPPIVGVIEHRGEKIRGGNNC